MTDITWPNKSTGSGFTAVEANEIKTAVNSKLDADAGGDPAVVTVNAATYSLLAADGTLHVTYSATGVCTITWPTAQIVADRMVRIKDAGGNASVNNITIATEGSETIDGAASYVLTLDYSSITLYSDGTDLFII